MCLSLFLSRFIHWIRAIGEHYLDKHIIVGNYLSRSVNIMRSAVIQHIKHIYNAETTSTHILTHKFNEIALIHSRGKNALVFMFARWLHQRIVLLYFTDSHLWTIKLMRAFFSSLSFSIHNLPIRHKGFYCMFSEARGVDAIHVIFSVSLDYITHMYISSAHVFASLEQNDWPAR